MTDYIPIRSADQYLSDLPYEIHNFTDKREAQEIVLSPLNVNFEYLTVGQQSQGVEVTLFNRGYDTTHILSVQIVGDFLLVGELPTSIPVGESASFLVRANPQRNANFTGGVFVQTGGANTGYFLPLTGSSEEEVE
jgi:hypothetical protein